jgi:hypothetical protein
MLIDIELLPISNPRDVVLPVVRSCLLLARPAKLLIRRKSRTAAPPNRSRSVMLDGFSCAT